MKNITTETLQIMHSIVRVLMPKASITNDFCEETLQKLLSESDLLDLYHRVERLRNSPLFLKITAHRQLGDAPSAYRGQGLDYDESRRYQAGDEPRFMNWRLSARTGELHMKVMQEERRPSTFILLDHRAPMRFGSNTRLKVTQACRVAAVAALLAQQQNTPVSGVILDKKPQWLRQANDEHAVFELIRQFAQPCPPQPFLKTKSCFSATLNTIVSMLTPGCNIYLISDFHDLTTQHRPLLVQLSAQHKVRAIHIEDPLERTLPRIGKINFIDTESSQLLAVNTSDNKITEIFEHAAKTHFNNIKQLFRSLDITYKTISTEDNDVENELMKM